MKKNKFSTLHIRLFYLVILLIPLNLGKHFVFNWSYVGGVLVDYLIPAIFVTDILILILLISWFSDIRLSGFKRVFIESGYIGGFIVLLLVSLLLSTISSISQLNSIHYLLHQCLYAGFFFYVLDNIGKIHSFLHVTRSLSIAVLFLGILAVFQWVGQGSVFDNYLFLGEQPYSASTKGIAIENVFGKAMIPVYGTFRHPNVFAGFLSLVLIWIIFKLKHTLITILLTILSFFALFVTFSQIAWLATLFGLFFCLANEFFGKRTRLIALVSVLFFVLAGLGLPFLDGSVFNNYPSIYRRKNLGVSSIKLINEYPLFGTGPNTNTILIEENLPITKDLRFVQPVHNIFILLRAESGIFSLCLFLILFIIAIFYSYKNSSIIYYSLLQLLILGSFDHYLLTSNQGLILLWLTLALALTYNKFDYECKK